MAPVLPQIDWKAKHEEIKARFAKLHTMQRQAEPFKQQIELFKLKQS